jgi:predicted NBD/HSP70 family sugar kinase
MSNQSNGFVVGRPGLLRAINEQHLLNTIRTNGPIARADLTRLSGLSKPTIGLTLGNLIEEGLVQPAGRRTGQRGPTAQLYGIRADAGYALALDVGSEFVRGALADIRGTVLARGSRRVHAASRAARLSSLFALADSLVSEAGVELDDLNQIVVGSPGVFTPQRDPGTEPAAGWPRPGGGKLPLPIPELIRVFGPGIVVENDVNLAALAEGDHGHGRGVDSFAFVSIGTGVGMGLVVSGQLHPGAHGSAGEIGFMPVQGVALGGSPAFGGMEATTASFESLASAPGVVRAGRAVGLRGGLTARRIFEAAARGDGRAAEVVAAEVTIVARALAAMATVADPGLVVLGGGIGRAPGLAQAVHAEMLLLLPAAPDVRVSALGEEAIVDGALVAGLDMAWEKLIERS